MNAFENGVLSSREEQILQLAAKGLTDKEIAAQFEVSLATVRSYWERLRTKTGAVNRASAVAIYVAEQSRDRARTQGQRSEDVAFAHLAMDAIDGGIIVLDISHHIVYANGIICRLLNRRNGTLEGRPVHDVIPTRYGAFHDLLRAITYDRSIEMRTISSFARVDQAPDLLVRITLRAVQIDSKSSTVLFIQDAIAELDARRKGVRGYATIV